MLHRIRAVATQIEQVVIGKQSPIKLALTCLLANGHLLIEDLPGVGKTTLANALSLSLGLVFKRVQFTNDLLPADVIGISIFDPAKSSFTFHKGPVFTQILLADEINRASPKTQSALLEAMEEQQVSVDGETFALAAPFFVIATQNPQEQAGTFPLPESQLDRFLMCIELGYPDTQSERALLEGQSRRAIFEELRPQITPAELLRCQQDVLEIKCAPPLLDYIQSLLQSSRRNTAFSEGLSPRCGLGLLRATRAWAWLEGRDYAIPDDVQAVLPAVAGHRLRGINGTGSAASPRVRSEWATQLLQSVKVP